MAIPFGTAVAVSRARPTRVGHSARFGTTEFDLDNEPATTDGWGRYLHGMARMLADHGVEVGGFDATVVSDIPARRCHHQLRSRWRAAWRSLRLVDHHLSGPTRPPRATGRERDHRRSRGNHGPAHLRRRVRLGDPHRLSLARAAPGCAAGLRSYRRARHRHPSRSRRLEYAPPGRGERVAAALGVEALRDAALRRSQDRVDLIDRRRARHVVSENERTSQRSTLSMPATSSPRGLMDESHESLHLDFEVTAQHRTQRSNSPERSRDASAPA